MKIEKKGYSRNPWRLVASSGYEVSVDMRIEHPSLGWTVVSGPVCGNTKQECIEKSLGLLSSIGHTYRAMSAAIPALETAVRQIRVGSSEHETKTWVSVERLHALELAAHALIEAARCQKDATP